MAWTLHHGDCLAVMATLVADSIDAIVTDPPYGLSFMGKGWDHGVPGEPFWKEAHRIAKPGAHLLAFGGTRTFHRLACAIEDAGWEIRDCLSWLYGSGFPKSKNLDGAWQGFGTALKPAWEPVILARKPLSGAVAANVLRYGTGAVNVDGCRIRFASEDDKAAAAAAAAQRAGRDQNAGRTAYGKFTNGEASIAPYLEGIDRGRWPANVCFDEEAAEGLGSESRYFYAAKASRSEREIGLDGAPRKKRYESRHAGQIAMGDDGSGNPYNRGAAAVTNHHPNVKPVDLMRWLVRLVTPPGGTVLDPFAGSGSTLIAALREGFSCVGIEREAEYVEIAKARIVGDAPLLNGAMG